MDYIGGSRPNDDAGTSLIQTLPSVNSSCEHNFRQQAPGHDPRRTADETIKSNLKKKVVTKKSSYNSHRSYNNNNYDTNTVNLVILRTNQQQPNSLCTA